MSKLDVALIHEILRQILHATETISKRFRTINSPADFIESDEGLIYLDAICMQLIAIGESVKNLDKITDGAYLPSYPDVEWKRVMGMRDVLSHHYFDLDAAIVFNVCERDLHLLSDTITRMQKELEE
ncbi:MAG: DUF86 domain-containing protein [Chloroflexi bacterium]|nr:DUF86 domain-containing protein [Chloroflexota bacterium]